LSRLYVDGAQVASASAASQGTMTDATSSFSIGQLIPSGALAHSQLFNGYIDEVSVWKTALSASDITTIYNTQAPAIQAAHGGVFTSRIFDNSSSQTWTFLNWIPTLPFMKEIPATNELKSNYTSLVGSNGASGDSALATNLAGLWHLDETAGNFADSTAGANPLVPTAVTQGANGRIGYGAKFNGTTAYAITATSTAGLVVGAGAWTASTWFNCSANPAAYGMLLLIYNGNSYWDMTITTSGYANIVYRDSSANAVSATDATSHCDGIWHLFTSVLDRTANLARIYVDGVQTVTGNAASVVNVATGTRPLQIGASDTSLTHGATSANFFPGSLDEVAVWSRALDPAEVKQLYQRGASRLKFQVRSCSDNTCTTGTPTWKGPDGTASTYFSELDNMSTQAATPSGTVNTVLPVLNFASYTSAPAANRYFQYRTIFETDSSTAALMPEVKNITVGPYRYDTTAPSVFGTIGPTFYTNNNFKETLGSNACSSGVLYNISLDKTNWYYWTGAAWALADGTTGKANPVATVAANIASFSATNGTLYFKAYLQSSGTSACELDNIEMDGTQ
jgi:hypothetical protein